MCNALAMNMASTVDAVAGFDFEIGPTETMDVPPLHRHRVKSSPSSSTSFKWRPLSTTMTFWISHSIDRSKSQKFDEEKRKREVLLKQIEKLQHMPRSRSTLLDTGVQEGVTSF